MFFSLSILVSLLASSVSALTTPHLHAHNARDHSLAARHHHHHIARQPSTHPLSRRSARRKRCNPPTSLPIDVARPHSTTTTTSAPPTTTTPSNGGGGGGGETHSGDGTYYDVGLGACGKSNINSDFIVAIGWELFDSFATGNSVNNPNLNPVCGRKIRASYEGKSVEVAAVDRCGGCQKYDLDFSPTAFSHLADFGVGRLKNVQWQFI